MVPHSTLVKGVHPYDAKPSRSARLGSVALQSGEHAGETIAAMVAGKKTKPFKYRNKGTMATIGRGAAVVQMLGGKTMKGKQAQLAWGTVRLALLPRTRIARRPWSTGPGPG